MPRLEYQLWLRLDGARDAWVLVDYFPTVREAETELGRRETAGGVAEYKVVKVEVVL